MTESELYQLKFPVGEFNKPSAYTTALIDNWINTIAAFPERINILTKDLETTQLNWKYRPDGWSIKQVVHHCADSHINSLIRFKLALTESSPEIRPYYEDRWAKLIDGQDNDISDSLLLLKALHSKWVKLLRNLSAEDLEREFIHPEHKASVSLAENIGIYAWHCNHHAAHVEQALNSKGIYNS